VNTCPNGHRSGTTDYCDTCGARMGSSVPSHVKLVPPPAPAPAVPDVSCPHCGTVQPATDKYCEGCGYDFTTGTAPARSVTATPPVVAPTSSPVWEAVITADPAWHARSGSDAPLPTVPERRFPITGDQVLIGRRSDSRGIFPQIDLSHEHDDTAISRAHCTLVRQPDGSYSLVDAGSTNGTFVNDNPVAITKGQPVPLVPGDRIHIGSFTTLTIAST
jgi:FHA domain